MKHVERAAVKLLKKGGQGILVEGNLILTAAHCVDFKCDGEMVLGNDFLEPIQTCCGVFNVAALAVEPVNDLAVLGPVDGQVLPADAEAFEDFCAATKSVPICTSEFELFKEIPISIFTHKGAWIRGQAQQCANHAAMLFIHAEEQIEGGTSGSPIVNRQGEVVGIVSHSSTGSEDCHGRAPRPHLVMPAWAYQRIPKAAANPMA